MKALPKERDMSFPNQVREGITWCKRARGSVVHRRLLLIVIVSLVAGLLMTFPPKDSVGASTARPHSIKRVTPARANPAGTKPSSVAAVTTAAASVIEAINAYQAQASPSSANAINELVASNSAALATSFATLKAVVTLAYELSVQGTKQQQTAYRHLASAYETYLRAGQSLDEDIATAGSFTVQADVGTLNSATTKVRRDWAIYKRVVGSTNQSTVSTTISTSPPMTTTTTSPPTTSTTTTTTTTVPPATPVNLTLAVTGSGSVASITIDINGNQTQDTNFPLPLQFQVPESADLDPINVVAQTADGSPNATISCAISSSSGTLTTNSSYGPYAVVSCSEDLGAYARIGQQP